MVTALMSCVAHIQLNYISLCIIFYYESHIDFDIVTIPAANTSGHGITASSVTS